MTDLPDLEQAKSFPRIEDFNVRIELTCKQKIERHFRRYQVTQLMELTVRIFNKEKFQLLGHSNTLFYTHNPPTISDYRAAYMQALEEVENG